jgi:membrane dipeptidase
MGGHELNPSRRKFLAALAGTGGAMLLGPDRLRSAEIDPRVAQIVSGTIAVDMHSHVQMRFLRNPADARPDPDLDIAGEMKRSGFSAVCQTYSLDALGSAEVGDYPKYFLQTLAFEDRLLARNHMGRALNFKDLQTAHDQKQPIIIQSVEGAQFIEGRLERIEEAYMRGLRLLQPLHERDDNVSPLGDVYTAAAAHLGGLTPFGAQVIKECNRLGVLVDITHGTQETVLGALKVATKPMILSHTGLSRAPNTRGVSADLQRRLINKDLAREVAAAGGVIGVWWRLVVTMSDYVAGIRDMVDAVGIDHVGIGTDTDLTSSYALPYTNKIWADENGGFFYAVAGEMLKQGFTPDEIGKIGGGNFCRIFASIA